MGSKPTALRCRGRVLILARGVHDALRRLVPDLLPPLALRRALAARRLVPRLGARSLGVAGEAAGGGVPPDGGVGVARQGDHAKTTRSDGGGGRKKAAMVRETGVKQA